MIVLLTKGVFKIVEVVKLVHNRHLASYHLNGPVSYFASHLEPIDNKNMNIWSSHFRRLNSCVDEMFVFYVMCQRFESQFMPFIIVALWNRADHYIFAMWFLLFSVFFFLA